jgi:hypothetical protein
MRIKSMTYYIPTRIEIPRETPMKFRHFIMMCCLAALVTLIGLDIDRRVDAEKSIQKANQKFNATHQREDLIAREADTLAHVYVNNIQIGAANMLIMGNYPTAPVDPPAGLPAAAPRPR